MANKGSCPWCEGSRTPNRRVDCKSCVVSRPKVRRRELDPWAQVSSRPLSCNCQQRSYKSSAELRFAGSRTRRLPTAGQGVRCASARWRRLGKPSHENTDQAVKEVHLVLQVPATRVFVVVWHSGGREGWDFFLVPATRDGWRD